MVFHLIRTFHIGFFFWHCHMAFLLMSPRGLISFVDCPPHQLEINLITNILSWTIEWLWIHHKILMFTNAPTSRFGFASLWWKEDEAWSFFIFLIFFLSGHGLWVDKAFTHVNLKNGLLFSMNMFYWPSKSPPNWLAWATKLAESLRARLACNCARSEEPFLSLDSRGGAKNFFFSAATFMDWLGFIANIYL